MTASSLALLVAAAPRTEGPDVVAALAGDAQLVVGVDGGAARCLAAGVVPNVVVGDMDSLPEPDRAVLEHKGVRFVVASVDKDVTDLDLAIVHAVESGASEIVATGCTSGRIDHTLAALGSLVEAAGLRPRVVEQDVEIWILAPASRQRVEVTPASTVFSVLSATEDAVVSVAGAVWPLDMARVSHLGSLGVSNVAGEHGAIVTVHEGVVLVIAQRTTPLGGNGAVQ